ncbi:MAG: hypothetical protein ACLP6E_15930, partial [Acidimicrobiales bacterium]
VRRQFSTRRAVEAMTATPPTRQMGPMHQLASLGTLVRVPSCPVTCEDHIAPAVMGVPLPSITARAFSAACEIP